MWRWCGRGNSIAGLGDVELETKNGILTRKLWTCELVIGIGKTEEEAKIL